MEFKRKETQHDTGFPSSESTRLTKRIGRVESSWSSHSVFRDMRISHTTSHSHQLTFSTQAKHSNSQYNQPINQPNKTQQLNPKQLKKPKTQGPRKIPATSATKEARQGQARRTGKVLGEQNAKHWPCRVLLGVQGMCSASNTVFRERDGQILVRARKNPISTKI